MLTAKQILDELFECSGKQLCLPILIQISSKIIPITDVVFSVNPEVVYLTTSDTYIKDYFKRYGNGITFHRYSYLINRLREKSESLPIVVRYNDKIFTVEGMFLNYKLETLKMFIADDIFKRDLQSYPIIKAVDF